MLFELLLAGSKYDIITFLRVQNDFLDMHNLNRNTASESIKQKLVFAGSEEGKLIALRQSFAEV